MRKDEGCAGPAGYWGLKLIWFLYSFAVLVDEHRGH